MEYSVEDISPVKKKVTITTEPQEAEAAILGAVALYRDSVQLDGFRKGKVPASVVEKRFHDRIYDEARQDLINVHINDVMQKLGVQPVSGISISGAEAPLERGKGYTYSMEFEVLPAFELPPYEGLEVEQEAVRVDDAEVADVIERIRRDRAKIVPVDGTAPAADGQIANIDFEAFENGEPVPGVKAEGFDLTLGEREALEDFEALVKTIRPGGEGEGQISFPADFVAPDLAGKTVTMKVKVHAVKERQLPPIDDELAKAMGQESVDKLRAAITDSYVKTRERLHRGAAQKKLLDSLLKMVDFPLPEAMLEADMRTLMTDLAVRLERQGKRLDALGKTEEELRKELLPQAEEATRSLVLLLTIARKEGLEVSEQEVATQIYQNSLRTGQDFKTLQQEYERSGLIFLLRDRLLADKAMDRVYAKAKVKEVPPAEAGNTGAAPDAPAAAAGE
ncbi:trigger factor [uncultured Desulfovibrio sp.]|uniref:trigger factor n=1 Tax=uncultured Desulfovibrio sp. TaxID=167968 RepID=UPI002805353A|nr:trigger factor [uncultured Desulfovibrio sp.]